MPTAEQHQAGRDLLAFIDASPSPWHAAAEVAARLQAAGFVALDETASWSLLPGGQYFVVRGGSSLIAFVIGQKPAAMTGLRLVGAHTDSPGLRLKPHAAHRADGVLRLGVEVYGGPILASFTDRDLGLAGRVMVRTANGIESRLLRTDGAVARLANLAIHMNREVNEAGLKLNKQTELPLLFAISADSDDAEHVFGSFLAECLRVSADAILAWDIGVFDVQSGSLWGPQREFLASGRLDNLASCHAGLTALLATTQPDATCVLGLFDHEEVGSTSATGAGGSFLSDVIARLVSIPSVTDDLSDLRQRVLASSFFISADMAHAWHPNFPAAYEPSHRVLVNAGPVIKINANQRYSTGADTAARFIELCETAGVPYQRYAHRTDLGCGSTIGPILAAQLGVPSVDVGCPIWSMHSARESAGVVDHSYMTAVLQTFFGKK
jgi:aspartyl aminopeptidase